MTKEVMSYRLKYFVSGSIKIISHLLAAAAARPVSSPGSAYECFMLAS